MASSNQIKSGWSWQKKLKRAVEVLREEGIKSFWFKLLSEIGYRRYLLLELSLEEPIPEVRFSLPVTIDLLKKTEVDEYVMFQPGIKTSDIADRLNAGHWCFVARHEGKLISATWATIHRTWTSYLARAIHFMPDEVYFYDVFTRPDFRGKSILPAILVDMIRYFRDAGYRRMVCLVLPENKSSLKALQKVAFHPLGMMGYIKIGPWRWHFYRTRESYDLL